MADKIHFDSRDLEDYCWFHCPGCGVDHGAVVNDRRPENAGRLANNWNGSSENPTFRIGIMPIQDRRKYCFCFIKDGRIRFHIYCHHHLAGKTIELPDW